MSAALQDHPADLIAEAGRLEAQAELEMVAVRNLRAEAAKLRSRAENLRNGSYVTVKPAPQRDDPLLAAAALAAEDLPGTWISSDLARALGIGDANRALRLCVKLREMGHVEHTDGRWRSVDPEIARIRDAVIELAEFTREQLAERVELRPEALTWYLADLRRKGIISGGDHEQMRYEPTGRETVVTRRRHMRAPEQEVIDQRLSSSRGRVVELTGKPMIESGGNRRQAGQRKSKGGTVRKHKRN
jgi:hypothetical protein